MNNERVVLAVGAHPDDVEFFCAGTLALLKQRGWNIHIASMSPGDLGTATHSREEIAAIRREEARRAAELLSAQYRCLESGDFCIFFGDELCRRATDLVRAVDPVLVLTHSPIDYLADHEETSRIVRQACFAAPVRNYLAPGGHSPTESIPHLYYFDPVEQQDWSGARIAATTVVDISTVIDVKKDMLSCHASQREWLRSHHHTDHYVEQMLRWSADRGREVSAAYGEGFRQHVGHPYPRSSLLADVLPEIAHDL